MIVIPVDKLIDNPVDNFSLSKIYKYITNLHNIVKVLKKADKMYYVNSCKSIKGRGSR